jgi:hypothetical protein
MEEDALESSSEYGSSLDEPSWVSWFCMLRNHEFFCEVDPAFVQDRFNLYGLKEIVGPLYGEAMTMILGYAPTGSPRLNAEPPCTHLHLLPSAQWWVAALVRRGPVIPGMAWAGGSSICLLAAQSHGHTRGLKPRATGAGTASSPPPRGRVFFCLAEKQLSDPTQRIHKVLETARILYGLIHARYVLTAQGLTDMKAKYKAHEFGSCPRTLCEKQTVLPTGVSDTASLRCASRAQPHVPFRTSGARPAARSALRSWRACAAARIR